MTIKCKACHTFCLLGAIVLLAVCFIIGSFMAKPTQTNTATVATEGQISKITSFVDQAAALVEQEGENAFTQFRQQGSVWWQGDSYIFAYGMDGLTLVLPPTPDIEGTNRMSVQDSNGVYFIREMVNGLQNNTSAWVSYSYPKPGEKLATPKLAYVKKVKLGSKFIFVGSGVYY